jgi:hypothetical protein
MLVILTKSVRAEEPSPNQAAGLAADPPEAAERRVHESRMRRIVPGMRNEEPRRDRQGLGGTCPFGLVGSGGREEDSGDGPESGLHGKVERKVAIEPADAETGLPPSFGDADPVRNA